MEEMPFIQGDKARRWVFKLLEQNFSLIKENELLKQENKKITDANLRHDANKKREEWRGAVRSWLHP